jgi:hypothetical protein
MRIKVSDDWLRTKHELEQKFKETTANEKKSLLASVIKQN